MVVSSLCFMQAVGKGLPEFRWSKVHVRSSFQLKNICFQITYIFTCMSRRPMTVYFSYDKC